MCIQQEIRSGFHITLAFLRLSNLVHTFWEESKFSLWLYFLKMSLSVVSFPACSQFLQSLLCAAQVPNNLKLNRLALLLSFSITCQKIIEHQVGRDLKAHLVHSFLTKACPRQDGPAPCLTEPYVSCWWGVHHFSGEIIPEADSSLGEKFGPSLKGLHVKGLYFHAFHTEHLLLCFLSHCVLG